MAPTRTDKYTQFADYPRDPVQRMSRIFEETRQLSDIARSAGDWQAATAWSKVAAQAAYWLPKVDPGARS